MSQVVANLLNNAAKYTPRGGDVTLAVRTTADAVTISVRDTGIGIPSHNLSRVFEMFTQLETGQERAATGLGIGLTLARRIVELHGGSIEAASDGPGRGSAFTVRLPRPSVPRALAPPAEHAGIDDVPQGRRVLVVDDNRDAADSLAMVLTGMGAEVRVAYDGPAGLDLVERFRPEFLLLDLGMPGMDGYEVARRVRQGDRGRDIVLVATTGWGQEQDKTRARLAGFDHHLTKPVDPRVFSEIIAGTPRG
jgi:CheY-like chemotaxis protein